MTDLELRWNKAATDAGFVGSEWIDDPERIFRKVKEMRHDLLQAKITIVRLRREEAV
jgi:hypothetical protein